MMHLSWKETSSNLAGCFSHWELGLKDSVLYPVFLNCYLGPSLHPLGE